MDHNLAVIWEKCLQFMRDNLDASESHQDKRKLESSFDLLFDKVQPLSLQNHNLTLLVPSDFYKEYIEENYLNLLSTALRKYIGKGVKLWYSVMENKPVNSSDALTQKYKGNTVATPKIQEVKTAPQQNMVNPFVNQAARKINIESNLNPNHSFDTFVEGESNKFASSVAKTIAKRPGSTSFNPLFIHGGVGVGKTHLAQAVGLEVKNAFPEKVVLYSSSEQFIQQFVAAARAHRQAEFANFFNAIDVWILDDIQFLAAKKATQDSFFHIFDYLHQNGKQIILTSDRAPVDIQDIQERIVSRFKWGLSAEVKSPDLDTRKKIFQDKLSRDGIQLSEEIIDYLAAEVKSNVRDIIGVVNAVIAHSVIAKSDITFELLKETINKISNNQKKTINIPYIQEVVCDYFGIKREQLLSKTRKREIALPRQLAMYFAKEYTNATFTKIGEEMGGKDHSTVMYACDTIRDVSKIDKELKKYLKDLKEKITQ